MDKLYSSPALTIKAVYNVMLSPLYILFSSLLSFDDGFLYIMFSCVPIGCLFTIPFWLSLNHIRKYRVNKIGKYIVYDAVYCLLPAILGIVFSEILVVISSGKTAVDGVVTVVFSAIFILITCIFWLLDLLFSHRT